MAKKGDLVVGLDIGTTKVLTVVGERNDAGGLDVIGYGMARSRGLHRGVVVDVDATVTAIRSAVVEAEAMAGCKIDSVFAGIAGAHIRAFDSNGATAIRHKEVRTEDVARVLDLARAVPLPQDREILHVLPREYVIDNQDGTKTPLGICGVRLEARVHIVSAATNAVQNITRCANLAGLKVSGIVLEPLASSKSVLMDDERELGVCLVDIGGGTTDIAVFVNGSLVHTAVIPLGGNHITQDIITGLRTPRNAAESLKCKYGSAMTSSLSADEDIEIEVQSVGDRQPRKMSRNILCQIIEPRVEDIFTLIGRAIKNWEGQLTSGIVITGGSSLIPNIEELGEDMLGLIVRRGVPRGIGGLAEAVKNPQFSTAVGLAIHGLHDETERFYLGRSAPGMMGSFKEWIKNVF